MPRRPVSPSPTGVLHRYLLHFAWPNGSHLTSPIGVTAFTVDDALSIIREDWGLAENPVPIDVDEDVDLSTIPAARWKAPVGPTNWRGVWYPFYQLD